MSALLPSPREARAAVRALGRRLAAAGALLVALLSLCGHAPVWLACLRGAATLFVLALGARLGAAALGKALEFDRARARATAREEARS
jgi:hypothetical protein